MLGISLQFGLWGIAAFALAQPALAQDVPVPSGLPVTLLEVIVEQSPEVARFRFVAPAIDPAGLGVGFGDVADDIQHLCDAVALPALARNGWMAGDVVISLSAQETQFGEPAPEVVQFFQPFTIKDGSCIWEDF